MKKKIIGIMALALTATLVAAIASPKAVKADVNDGYLTMSECSAFCDKSNQELSEARRQYDNARYQLDWARSNGSQQQVDQASRDVSYWSGVVNAKLDKYNHALNIYNSVGRLRTDLQYLEGMRDKLNNRKIIYIASQEVATANQAVLDKQNIANTYKQCADQANANAAVNPGFQPVADQANVAYAGAMNEVAAAQAVVAAKQANLAHLQQTLPLPSDSELMQIALIEKDFEPVMAEFAIANRE